MDRMHRWFPYSVVDRPVHNLVEAVLRSRKKNVGEALGKNSLYGAPADFLVMLAAEGCCPATAVAFMCLHYQVDPEVVNISPISLRVLNVFNVELNAE